MKKLKEYVYKLNFWFVKNRIKDGRDFDVKVDDIGMLITILRGKFKGVQFRYSPLKVLDYDGLVDFRTYVEYTPENVDVSEPKFAKLTTNILRILLEEAIPETESQTKELVEKQVMNENRDTDTVEFNQERELHEEVSPLLEKRVSKRKSRAKAIPADSGVYPQVQQPAKPKRARARTTGKKGSKRK